MDEYLPNSNLSKRQSQTNDIAERKIEKVVKTSGKRQERTGLQKIVGSFVSTDTDSIFGYLASEVLIPALKKMLSDTVTNGIDMLLYGEAGRPKNSSSTSKVSYRSYYDSDRKSVRSGTANRGFEYDQIIFDTRGDAQAVLIAMDEVIDNYRMVSVADLFDLADVPNDNFNANKYGWTNLNRAEVVRVRDGYSLKLPKALPLD